MSSKDNCKKQSQMIKKNPKISIISILQVNMTGKEETNHQKTMTGKTI